ncbi:MAG: glycosyltransferase [Planctomycetota bacterium]
MSPHAPAPTDRALTHQPPTDRAPTTPLRHAPGRQTATKVDVTVAVVSYRSLGLLLDSAQTWAAAAPGLNVEWRILENGTGDSVAQALHDAQPALARHAVCHELEHSVSFARANNIALRGFRGRHVVLLNPDTLLRPGSLTELVAFLDDHPDVAVVGPRVWDDPACTSIQRSWRRFPGLTTAIANRQSLLARLWPKNPWTRDYLNLDRSPDVTQDTDWVSGCCLAVRGDVFRALGGLDAGYPMFCEDVDLCRGAHRRGWRVVYHPRAEIVHLVGGSRRRAPLRAEWQRHRSMTRYVLKYDRPWNPLSWTLIAGIWMRFATRTLLRCQTS